MTIFEVWEEGNIKAIWTLSITPKEAAEKRAAKLYDLCDVNPVVKERDYKLQSGAIVPAFSVEERINGELILYGVAYVAQADVYYCGDLSDIGF